MSNAYFDLLLAWIGHAADTEHSPHRDAIYAEAVTVGLDALADDTVASQLAQFIGVGKIPERFHQTLRTCSHASIRVFAWRTYHATASLADWQEAIAAETDESVLEEMVRYAPATELSEDLKWTILRSPDTFLDVARAQQLINLPLRAGWEDQWREAIYAMHPDTVFQGALKRLMEPLITGEVSGLDPTRADEVYLLAEALALKAPPGAITDLLTTRPQALSHVRANTEVATWILNLARTAVNRSADLVTLREHLETTASNLLSAQQLVELDFWVSRATELDAEQFTIRVARLIRGSGANAQGATALDLALCWERLTTEQRTDEVCTKVLKAVGDLDTDLAYALAAEVVEQLGEKAYDVANDAGLLETKKFMSSMPPWWRLLNLEVWVRGFALVNRDTAPEAMAALPQKDFDALLSYLHDEPLEWAPAAIKSLLHRTDLGPDVWQRLSIDQLMSLMTVSAAANWLATVVTEERMSDPLVRQTLMAGSDRELPFGDLVTATHAIA